MRRGWPWRIGHTSCMNMFLKPRRFRMPVSVEVATLVSASRVYADNSTIWVFLLSARP